MNLGTDFSMIEQYFPGRTRTQIKRKYKTEEKKNPQLINSALTHTTHFDSELIERMIVDDKPEEDLNNEDSNVSTKTKATSRKRRHKDVKRSECSRMSVCAYMMEEEIVLKNKKIKQPTKVPTASNLKKKVLSLQSIKDKKNTEDEKSTKETVLPKIEDQNKTTPKVRTLQDFQDEYEETITKYEDNSNSE